MKFVKIAGLGKYLPSKRLLNSDLEKTVETSNEWIIARTGIKERRIAEDGVGTSSLAYKASQVALERAGVNPKDLDLIIVATITPDTQFPSTACYLQDYLKAKNAACFDISAACAGFVYALVNAWQLIRGGLYKNVLVVGAEVLSTITDWEDRSTCVLFGDGAGAAVLTESTEPGFLSAYLGSDGSQTDILNMPGGGSRNPVSPEVIDKRMHYMKMKGNEIFKIAVRIMVEAANKALARADLDSSSVDMLIPHQANERIITAVAKRLHIPKDKVYVNIARYGNMSSASSAIALCEAWEDKRINPKDIVVLDAFGGGLVWGSCVIKWV